MAFLSSHLVKSASGTTSTSVNKRQEIADGVLWLQTLSAEDDADSRITMVESLPSSLKKLICQAFDMKQKPLFLQGGTYPSAPPAPAASVSRAATTTADATAELGTIADVSNLATTAGVTAGLVTIASVTATTVQAAPTAPKSGTPPAAQSHEIICKLPSLKYVITRNTLIHRDSVWNLEAYRAQSSSPSERNRVGAVGHRETKAENGARRRQQRPARCSRR